MGFHIFSHPKKFLVIESGNYSIGMSQIFGQKETSDRNLTKKKKKGLEVCSPQRLNNYLGISLCRYLFSLD